LAIDCATLARSWLPRPFNWFYIITCESDNYSIQSLGRGQL